MQYLDGPSEAHASGPWTFLYLGKSPGGNVLSVAGALVRADASGVTLYREIRPDNPFVAQVTRYAVQTIPWARIWSISGPDRTSIRRHRNRSFQQQAIAYLNAAQKAAAR